MKLRSCLCLSLALTLALPGAALAGASPLKITEVMSSSGGSGTADWFELTNFGATNITLTGYTMDDDSLSFGSSKTLLGVTTIHPNESVVFIESSAPVSDIAAFRSFWGNIGSIQIGTYSGSGVSLGSGGDKVIVFTGGNSTIDQVTFGTATTGVTFGYNTTTSTFGAPSSIGQFGAFQSANALHNVGSPGSVGLSTVPEPGSFAILAGTAAGGLILWRRRKAA